MSDVTSDQEIGRRWGPHATLGLLFSFLLLPPGEACARLHRPVPQELAALARETPREEREREHEHEEVLHEHPDSDERCTRSRALHAVSPSQLAQAPLLVSPRFSPRRRRPLPRSGTAGASALQPDALVEAVAPSASAPAVLNPAIFDSALLLLHSNNRLLLQPYELSPFSPPSFTFLAASDSLYGTQHLLRFHYSSRIFRLRTKHVTRVLVRVYSLLYTVYSYCTSKLIHIVIFIVIVALCFILV